VKKEVVLIIHVLVVTTTSVLGFRVLTEDRELLHVLGEGLSECLNCE
jgi:hypothetical protein